MKLENKTALVGLIGGICITTAFHFLTPPEIIENHIPPDTVFVAQPLGTMSRTEDSLTINSLKTTLNEKDSLLQIKPKIVYARTKATPADSTVDVAANNVLSSVQEADSSR